MEYNAGTLVGQFRIVHRLGGEVYRARDERLGREVALKFLPHIAPFDEEQRQRLEREARAAPMLDHPNLLTVYDLARDADGDVFLVTELLEGETLRALLESGPLSVSKAFDIGAQLARGLAYAHDLGLIHRDLKPENIFLTRDGRVKILDFGLAMFAETLGVRGPMGATAPGRLVGTIGYMAPEQALGEALDGRADIFSLGVVLYEMLTGTNPFRAASAMETLEQILTLSPPPPTTDPAINRIIARCLTRDRIARPSAIELFENLQQVFMGAPSSDVMRRGVDLLSLTAYPELRDAFLQWEADLEGDLDEERRTHARSNVPATVREIHSAVRERIQLLRDELATQEDDITRIATASTRAMPVLVHPHDAADMLKDAIAAGDRLREIRNTDEQLAEETAWNSRNRELLRTIFADPAPALIALDTQLDPLGNHSGVRIQLEIDALRRLQQCIGEQRTSPETKREYDVALSRTIDILKPLRLRRPSRHVAWIAAMLLLAIVIVLNSSLYGLPALMVWDWAITIPLVLVALFALERVRRPSAPPAQAAPDEDTAPSNENPFIRNTGQRKVIVFVHGVFGDAIETWTNEKHATYWPRMLAEDDAFDDADIYVHSFPSPYVQNTYNISELGSRLRTYLRNDGILAPHRELIFLCHSMGGLVTRACLLLERPPASRVRMLYFFSTPNTGADITTLAGVLSANPQLKCMLPMEAREYVLDLQKGWLQTNEEEGLRYQQNIEAYAAYELYPTFGVKIVTIESATNLCNRVPVALDRDHLDIVKPRGRRDDPYVYFRDAYVRNKRRTAQASPTDLRADLSATLDNYILSVEMTHEFLRNAWMTRRLLQAALDDYRDAHAAIAQRHATYQQHLASSAAYRQLETIMEAITAAMEPFVAEVTATLTGSKPAPDATVVSTLTTELGELRAPLKAVAAVLLADLRLPQAS